MPIRSAVNDQFSAGFDNLARMFAPATPNEVGMAETVKQNAAAAAAKAAAASTLGQMYGEDVGALAQLDPAGVMKQVATARGLRVLQNGGGVAGADPYVYLRDGNIGNTVGGKLMEKLGPNETRNLPPSIAGAYGVLPNQVGVIQTPDKGTSTYYPKGGPTAGVPASPGGDDDTPTASMPPLPPPRPVASGLTSGLPGNTSGPDPVAVAAWNSGRGQLSAPASAPVYSSGLTGATNVPADPLVAKIMGQDTPAAPTAFPAATSATSDDGDKTPNDGRITISGGRGGTARPMTPAEKQAYGLKPEQAGFMDADGTPKVLGGGGVNVSVGNGKNLGTNITDTINSSYTNAQAAAKSLPVLDRQEAALNSGMITGGGADVKMKARSLLSGILGLDDPGLNHTQEYVAAAQANVGNLAKQISGSGHTTNQDLNVAKMIEAADPNYTESALREIIAQQRIAARAAIDHHNAIVDRYKQIVPEDAKLADFYRVDPPPASAPVAAGPSAQNAGAPPPSGLGTVLRYGPDGKRLL